MGMSARGKWGITRDEDGSYSFLMEWPWYWRYPCGLAIIAASVACSVWLLDAGKNPWVAFGLGGIGVLMGLAIMYELGCLSILVAIGWGVSTAFEYWFPDVKISIPWQIGLVAAFAYYAWFVGNEASRLSAANARDIQALRSRIEAMEDARQQTNEHQYERLADLRDRVRTLERLENDPFADL